MSSSTRPDAGSVGPAWTQGEGGEPEAPLAAARYETGGELGRGGMGVVRVAVDAWLDREVAVKRPHADLSDAARERLVREARITARLDHPGIVPILDFGLDAEGPYYTMPVLAGRTLRQALPLPLPAAARVLVAAARAVAFAHARGVVHRDLKPENILIGAFGEVRVLDWGVALDPQAPDTFAVGTPGFQAPEQLTGEPVGPPADVFALGRTLAAALPDAPPALAAVAERATRPAPGERYADAGAFADELERWLDGRRVEAHDYTAWELVARLLAVWRGPLLLAAAASVALIALLGAWATTNGWERDRARAAERAARRASAEADANLATALRQAAASWLLADARPSAEVLAARSLALADTPEGRGVWMASYGLVRPERVASAPLPCPRAIPAGEALLCLQADRAWLVEGGVTRWTVEMGDRAPLRAAWHEGPTTAILHQDNALSVWRDGVHLRTHVHPSLVELVGDGLYLRDRTRVGVIEADGGVRWSVPLCERTEDAWTDGEAIAAVCAPDLLVIATFSAVKERVQLLHPPSAVTRDARGELVVGTFDGHLLTRGTGWLAEPSGVGAVERLTPWGELVVVEGETLTPHLWDAATGVSRARLPRRARVYAAGEALETIGHERQRWRLPPGPTVARLTRGGGGGLSFLALSPRGDAALGGNSSGDVTRWDLSTGAPQQIASGCLNAARAGVLFEDTAVAVQLGCTPPLFERDWRTGAELHRIPPMYARLLERWGDGLVMAAYSERLELVRDGHTTTLTGWFEAADPASDGVWLLTRTDEVGTARGDAFAPRFSVPDANDLVRTPAAVLITAGAALSAHDPETGARRWTWSAPRPLTALAAAGERAVVGDMDGAIYVIDAEGAPLASARGHRRRVSELRVHEELVYSASWDGTLRRWDLRAITAPLAALDAGAWGLTVAEVLAQPGL